MRLDDIKKIARERGIQAGRMKKAELVRTIQKSEQNDPCFETGRLATCDQMECLWREDCR